jgi:hypothetical protein
MEGSSWQYNIPSVWKIQNANLMAITGTILVSRIVKMQKLHGGWPRKGDYPRKRTVFPDNHLRLGNDAFAHGDRTMTVGLRMKVAEHMDNDEVTGCLSS